MTARKVAVIAANTMSKSKTVLETTAAVLDCDVLRLDVEYC